MIEAPVRIHESPCAARAETNPCVYVVDDDISVRESLELLLEEAGWEVLPFACAADFLAYPKASAPSCLVLDVELPDVNGLDMQHRLASERPATPIVFISGNPDVPMAVRAMKGGAVDLLAKPLRDEALLTAVECALKASRAELRRDAEVAAIRDRHACLTRRESEVMTLVVAGRLNKQVGGELGISEITVKAHRGSVMRKMMARSLPDLVTMAARLGIVRVIATPFASSDTRGRPGSQA
jgi:FixJ family two-component response regulator